MPDEDYTREGRSEENAPPGAPIGHPSDCQAGWDGQKMVGLDQFGKMVAADLWREIAGSSIYAFSDLRLEKGPLLECGDASPL